MPDAADTWVLAVGFGRNASEAGHRVFTSLQDGFVAARTGYEREWHAWQQSLVVGYCHHACSFEA